MPRRYVVALTSTERQTLETFTAQGKRSDVDLQIVQVLLKADLNHAAGGWTDPAISQALGLDIVAVEAVRQRFAEGRLASALRQPVPVQSAAKQSLLPLFPKATAIDRSGLQPSPSQPSRSQPPSGSRLSSPRTHAVSPLVRTKGRRDRPPSARTSRATQSRTVPLPSAQKRARIVPKWMASPWVVSGLTLGCLGLANFGALAWLTNVPPAPNCQLNLPLQVDGERLYCLNQAILAGNTTALGTGLHLVNTWNPEHPLFTQAQALANEWSAFSLVVARQKAKVGRLQEAIAFLRKVPPTSSHSAEAKALIQEWQATWAEGEKRVKLARTQLKQRNRTEALLQVKALAALNDDYWQTRADQLMNEIMSK